MPDLSVSAKIAFRLAAAEAKALQQENIDSEHLFLGLCKLESILQIERHAITGLDDHQWGMALEEIAAFRDFLASVAFDPQHARRRLRKILHESEPCTENFSGHRTQRCRDLFALAETMCRESSTKAMLPQHLWSALVEQPSLSLDRLFSEMAVKRSNLQFTPPEELKNNEEHELPLSKEKSNTPILDQFGRDLTQLARDGKLEPVLGRSTEIKKIAQVLMQKKKNNPILIGEAGVGKTAVVEGFALKVVEESAPKQIRNFRVIELSMAALVAGTKYRGEFEERLDGLIKEASADPNTVLFIDEIHTLVGAGAGRGSMDAGNIMKPALARGTIKCIGATTTAEYRKSIEKDPALERRFQVIWVDEPTKEEAILMLRGIRKKLEEHHGVIINDNVIAKAVELAMRYITDFRLPDKAIDILDQACARMMLKTFTPEIISATENATLTVDDIVQVVAERCKIPVGTLTIEEQERFLNIDDALKQRVLGQDHAIREVGKAITSAKAGLNEPNKPIVFLFAGSTGTGKTELAKALAEFLFHDANRLISFDMSEYQEKHSVAKLIGSPPGYVGYEEDGQLTGKIRSNPYSVLLFDEIEKAHPSIFDIFLQIFDEGRLTDAHGRRVNFSESVIILTTNLGSNIGQQQRRDRNPFGFKREQGSSALTPSNKERNSDTLKEYEMHIRKAIESAFRPEFLNRVQKQITFYPLAPETVKQIITQKILPALNNRLISRGIQVLLSEDAVKYLMDIGYKEAFGAREMQRVFDQNISEQLSHMILNGEVIAGQIVRLTAQGQGLQFVVD